MSGLGSAGDLISAIMAELNKSHVTAPLGVIVGVAGIAQHGSFPRVVWEPTGGSFDQPRPGVGMTAIRTILTDRAEYDVHCWGEDLDGARALMHEVVRAGRVAAGGYFVSGRYEWREAGQQNASGCAVVLRTTLLLGVAERTPTTQTILQAEALVSGQTEAQTIHIVVGDVPT